MTIDERKFRESIQNKDIGPPEEAALRRMMGMPFNESCLPETAAEQDMLLSVALIKFGKRYPEDLAGMCREIFDRPTIVVDQPPYSPIKRVCVQWEGRYTRRGPLPSALQFRFELVIKSGPDNICWMGHPENFNVAFLGLSGEWEPVNNRQRIADSIREGRIDVPMVWVWSNHYTVPYPTGEGPASFTAELISLEDQTAIINPQLFTDFSWQTPQ